jgi:hypothetical protein
VIEARYIALATSMTPVGSSRSHLREVKTVRPISLRAM